MLQRIKKSIENDVDFNSALNDGGQGLLKYLDYFYISTKTKCS